MLTPKPTRTLHSTGMKYLIALGANLGNREETFSRVLTDLEREVGQVIRRSAWYETKPVLHPAEPTYGQPSFLNGIVLMESALAPIVVLERMHCIEAERGRNRLLETKAWSPRIIDLDLLAAEGKVMHTPGLVLPHPELHRREFVLEPLCEIAPDWVHPLFNKTARALYDELLNR